MSVWWTIMQQLLKRERRRAVAADRRRRRPQVPWLICIVLFCALIPQDTKAATVFSTSFESCKEQCINRNIAIPLTRENTSWPSTVLAECDFDCHVESCRAGCQDLESFNSTCDTRCDSSINSAIKQPNSCWQGCRAVADIFLHQIQYLLNRVSVEVIHDTLQGLRLNWTFEDVHAPTLQEISAANIRWVAQTRAAGSCAAPMCAELCAWKWTTLDGKAFKNSKLKFTVSVPFEHCSEIQVRLAAIWRDTVVVSETVSQPMPLFDTAIVSDSASFNLLRVLPYSQLQISANSYLICWHSEARQREFAAIAGEQPSPRFRLRLFLRAENVTVLTAAETTTAAVKTIIPRQAIRTKLTGATCSLFRALPLENCCEIEIAELGQTVENSSDEDDNNHSSDDDRVITSNRHKNPVIATVTVKIELKNLTSSEESDSQAYIIFTDGRSLFVMHNLNDYVMVNEPPTIPFNLTEDVSITALASLSTKRLLIGLSDGSIYSIDMSHVEKSTSLLRRKREDNVTKSLLNESTIADMTTAEPSEIISLFAGTGDESDTAKATKNKPTVVEVSQTTRVRAPDGVAVVQITVDALQTRLYIVRERAGLMRCTNFDDCDNNSTMLTTTTNLQNSIQNVAVDSWNGFIYYSTANGDVFVTPLFPADAVGAFSLAITRRLADLPNVFTLNVDLRAQKLIAVLRNGSLWSRDLVDERLTDERASVALADGYKAVIHSQYLRNRLFWISKSCGDGHPWDSCLYSEEFDQERKSVHLNRYLFGGRVYDFVIMEEVHRPAYLPAPSRLGILVDGAEARINWKPPKPLPFQASGSSWRSYLYEYKLSSVVNVTDDLSIKSSLLADGKIEGTDVFVPLKSAAESLKTAGYVASVRACSRDGAVCSTLVHVHGRSTRREASGRRGVYVVTARKGSTDMSSRYAAFNLLGRELSAEKLPIAASAMAEISSMEALSLTLSVDNSTGAVYASTRRDISIYRVLDSGIRYRFLDYIAVRFVSVIAGRALILIASSYTIAAYRLTSSYEMTIYNCVGKDCGEVVGMAADEHGGDVRVFYFIRRRNGDVEMHRINAFGNEMPETVTLLNEFHSLRQAILIDDHIIVLTVDNQLGIFDTVALTWNFNFVFRDVLFIVGGETTGSNNRLHFKSVEYDPTHGELKWHIDGGGSTSERGQLLYKVELYRENFGGDRIVSLTPHSHYVIPRSVLNAWRSAQPFDVQVDVISAWTVASANRTALLAPSKPPSTPRHLNIYATQQKTVDGTRANIDLLWEEPTEWNGEMLGYLVNCTWDNGTQLVNTRVSARRSRAFSFVVKSGRLSCVVAAISEQGLVGEFSEPAIIDGSDLLVAIQNWTTPSIDANKNFAPIKSGGSEMNGSGGAVATSSSSSDGERSGERQLRFSRIPRQTPNLIQYQTVAFIGNELYAVRKEAEALFLVLLDINDISNVLYKGALVGDFGGQVEAMTSDWVGNRLLLVANHDFLQISLDTLQQTSMITPRRLFSLSSGAQDAKQLAFDPFINVAYLLTKNGSLFSLNLNRNGSESNLALELECLRSQTVTSIVAQFTWNRAASPYIFALTWNRMISINTALLKPNDGFGVPPAGSSPAASLGDVSSVSSDATTTKSAPLSDAFDSGSGKKCSDVGVNWDVFGEKGLKAISSFTVADKLFIFFTSNELLIYDRQSAVVSPVPIANPPLRQILAVSQSSQPYPDRSCFTLPPAARLNFTVKGEGRTGAVVEINEPSTLYGSCAPVSPPQTQYQIQFWRRGTDKVKVKNSYSRIVQIENGVLDKETDYDVLVLWYNRYTGQQNSVGGVFTPPVDVTRLLFRTGYGFPTAPVDPSACALTPDTVLLYWKMPHILNAPPSEIKYKVTQLSSALLSPVPIGVKQLEAEGTNGVGDIFSPTISDIVSCIRNSCRALIPNLRPAIDYQFWVTALHISRLNSQLADDAEAVSAEAVVRTKDIPGILRVEETLSDALTLRWNWLSPQSPPAKISVQYRQSGSDVLWLELRNSSFDPTTSAFAVRNISVIDLQSATTYDYRFVAEYIGGHTYDDVHYTFDELFYQQPQQTRTKAGTPSAPTDVRIEKNPDGWILQWSPPVSNGGEPVLTYAVEFRPNKDADWEIAERGIPASRLYWRIGRPWRDGTRSGNDGALTTQMPDVSDSSKATSPTTTTTALQNSNAASKSLDVDEEDSEAARRFGEAVAYRVRAANTEGFGAYASTLDDEKMAGKGDHDTGNAVPISRASGWRYFVIISTFAILLVGSVLFAFARQRKLILKHKKDKINRIINLETIASQIQYPYSDANFPPEVENELRNLPFVSKFAVVRKSLLGRGSFGEVWEGLLTDPDAPADAPKLRVAIKYLKQRQDDENRLKFLREAILMNNFDHPNIVKLLGVQRQVEPHFLVIELMEGGDLHSFLNASRPHDGQPSQLCLKELISIMIDIGRGGAYLETFKHVHRDLAARNCLISSKYSAQRVTKIADFGLARDIFSQDYYRIHGSDFLPLRWLAPESAVYGIFTNKSDVWAFGIVLWEIMTLGQQPYPGISNVEVLSCLHEGRPPKRPNECPDEIFAIIKLAWTFDMEKRPTFAELLSRLESLRSKPHLQSMEPFPLLPNTFDSSHGSSSANQQSSTATSCCSARVSNNGTATEYFNTGAEFDNSQEAGGSGVAGSASQTSLNQPAVTKYVSRFDKSENRPNQRGFKFPFGGGYLERPESTLSGNTMSITLDNEYEKPIRSGGGADGSPFFHLSRDTSNPIMSHPHHSSDAFSNAAFVNDASTSSTRPASLQLAEFFNASTPATPKSGARPSASPASIGALEQRGRFQRAFVSTPKMEARRGSYQSSPYFQKAARNFSGRAGHLVPGHEDLLSVGSSPYATLHGTSNLARRSVERDRFRSLDAKTDTAQAQAIAAITAGQSADSRVGSEGLRSCRKNDQVWGSGRISHV